MPRQYQKKQKSPKWTSDNLKTALELVRKRELTLRAAAYRFGTPKTTLHAHFCGTRSKVGAGRVTVLTPAEEKEIGMALQVLQEIGFPLTQDLAASVIQDFLKEEAITNPFNDDLPRRKPQNLSSK